MKKLPVQFAPTAVLMPMTAVVLVGFGAINASWAESLDEALAATYMENPTLLAARAELRGVNEGVPQELANYRPSAFVDGSAGVERIDTESSKVKKNTNLMRSCWMSSSRFTGVAAR